MYTQFMKTDYSNLTAQEKQHYNISRSNKQACVKDQPPPNHVNGRRLPPYTQPQAQAQTQAQRPQAQPQTQTAQSTQSSQQSFQTGNEQNDTTSALAKEAVTGDQEKQGSTIQDAEMEDVPQIYPPQTFSPRPSLTGIQKDLAVRDGAWVGTDKIVGQGTFGLARLWVKVDDKNNISDVLNSSLSLSLFMKRVLRTNIFVEINRERPVAQEHLVE